MPTWIVLFRGINVGGNNLLPMKALTALLERIGCTRIQTYIQSGNVVTQAKESNALKLAKLIESAVSKKFGFKPRVLLLAEKEFKKAASDNPFTQAESHPKTLHLWFLSERPKKPDLEALDALKGATEAFVLKGKVFYLHTPDGFGKSKLAARVEKSLGVDATARNWNTVTKLLEMARQADSNF